MDRLVIKDSKTRQRIDQGGTSRFHVIEANRTQKKNNRTKARNLARPTNHSSKELNNRERKFNEPLPSFINDVFNQILLLKGKGFLPKLSPETLETLTTLASREQEALEALTKTNLANSSIPTASERKRLSALDRGLVKKDGTVNISAFETRLKRAMAEIKGKVVFSLKTCNSVNQIPEALRFIDVILHPSRHGIQNLDQFLKLDNRDKIYLETKAKLLKELEQEDFKNINDKGANFSNRIINALNSNHLFLLANNNVPITSQNQLRDSVLRSINRALTDFENQAILAEAGAYRKRDQVFDAVYPERLNNPRKIQQILEADTAQGTDQSFKAGESEKYTQTLIA